MFFFPQQMLIIYTYVYVKSLMGDVELEIDSPLGNHNWE
jgi:hypothetical protein